MQRQFFTLSSSRGIDSKGESVVRRLMRPGYCPHGRILVPLVALFAFAVFGSNISIARAAATHPFLAADSLNGSNTPSGEFANACGAAVDSAGNVYIANSETSKIDVFSAGGTYLTTIDDAGLPCALAVNSHGDVYAVNSGDGTVVRYSPEGGTFPPVANQAYGPATVFEASGEAKGVAVDTSTNNVYVSTPTRVNAYREDGTLAAVNEVQEVQPHWGNPTGGTFTLSFEGAVSSPIALNAPAGEVRLALEALPTIGSGAVSVEELGSGEVFYEVSFTGSLGDRDVPPLVGQSGGLVGGSEPEVRVSPVRQGFKGTFGEGVLHHAFGVAAWDSTGQVYAADEDGVIHVFRSPATGGKELTEIDGEGRPGGPFAALPEVEIAVDQANGHVFVSDVAEGGAVDEFESTGHFVSQITHALSDAGPTAVAVDPSEGPSAQRVYVTSGPGAGSQVFAFGPLPTPTHHELPDLEPLAAETPAGEFKNVAGLAVDSQGDVYVNSPGTSAIDIFVPKGGRLRYLTSIPEGHGASAVAVDSEGNVYVSRNGRPSPADDVVMQYPLTSAYPFGVATPTYGAPVPIDSFSFSREEPHGLAIDPENDHLYIAYPAEVCEYGSAAEGSPLLRCGIGKGLGLGRMEGLAVLGSAHELFVALTGARAEVLGIDPETNEVLTVIDGENAVSKKPDGGWPESSGGSVAVDQSNGHVYVATASQLIGQDVYEFEASGAYVSRLGRSVKSLRPQPLGVDNSGGPDTADVFVGTGLNHEPASVNAYSPVGYGEPPAVTTGAAGGANGPGGTATLTGSVGPRGVPIEACLFEYVAKSKAEFESTGFSGGSTAPCAESAAEIGEGTAPVEVHVDLTGLSPSGRYFYRLTARSQFGDAQGEPRTFGAPEVSGTSLSEVLYSEAVLESTVDPAGLLTSYRCEYGPTIAYGAAVPATPVGGGGADVRVRCVLTTLEPGTAYHSRIVATNPWGSSPGEDQTFTTLAEHGGECPNAQFRVGPSAALPDCRAYELVTPDLGSVVPFDLRSVSFTAAGEGFGSPLASPEGEDVIFYGEGTPPGLEGTGFQNAYRAHRQASGWETSSAGPNGTQLPKPFPGATTPSHEYAFWGEGLGPTGRPERSYLRLPGGDYQLVGLGEGSATDPEAVGRFISEDGSHVIFSSRVQLAAGAPALGVPAVYDRPATGRAQLISTPPTGAPSSVLQEFAEDGARYQGSSADGSTVAFEVGSTLYVHRDGRTAAVAAGNLAFGGVSADGSRLFYVRTPSSLGYSQIQRGEAFAYDSATEVSTAIGSGDETVLVNVSADGSRVYFASRQTVGGGGVSGKENLYVSGVNDGVTFIATIADDDIELAGQAQRLGFWTQGVGPETTISRGPAMDTSRTNYDGTALTFESYANLTAYNSDGRIEVYHYDGAHGVRCVSCNLGAPATSGATLQSVAQGSEQVITLAPSKGYTLIPNLTRDGKTVFFETSEALVPQDRNGLRDVYEWKEGVVSLISSGQGSSPSFLLGASTNGRDVFFTTSEALTGADADGGGESIYDAREGGGFPTMSSERPCQGDECRTGSPGAPALNSPGSTALEGPGNSRSPRCPTGKRSVKMKKGIKESAKKRRPRQCIARHSKKKHVKEKNNASHHKQKSKQNQKSQGKDGS